MQIEKKIITIESKDVPGILLKNYQSVMSSFYEMQSGFFRSHYKIHKSLESACIILSFSREVHLQILRQREKNLDHIVDIMEKKMEQTKRARVRWGGRVGGLAAWQWSDCNGPICKMTPTVW